MFDTNQQRIALRALDYLLANADLTASEVQSAKAACDFIEGIMNGDTILSPWTTDDVKSLVDEDDEAEGELPVTDVEAREVLKQADEYHDASIGINWDVLREHLDMVRREK